MSDLSLKVILHHKHIYQLKINYINRYALKQNTVSIQKFCYRLFVQLTKYTKKCKKYLFSLIQHNYNFQYLKTRFTE